MLEKYFSVIGDAWKMNPITNIYLTTDIANCDDPAFKRTWGGLTQESRMKDKIKPITGSFFKDDVLICLERGASSWTDTFVSKSKDGGFQCQADLVACLDERVDQTVCVARADLETLCPITNVKIINKADYKKELYMDYTEAEVHSGEHLSWQLLYSRTYAGLPIERFDLTQERPCSLDSTFQVKEKPIFQFGWIQDKFDTHCHYDRLDSLI